MVGREPRKLDSQASCCMRSSSQAFRVEARVGATSSSPSIEARPNNVLQPALADSESASNRSSIEEPGTRLTSGSEMSSATQGPPSS